MDQNTNLTVKFAPYTDEVFTNERLDRCKNSKNMEI